MHKIAARVERLIEQAEAAIGARLAPVYLQTITMADDPPEKLAAAKEEAIAKHRAGCPGCLHAFDWIDIKIVTPEDRSHDWQAEIAAQPIAAPATIDPPAEKYDYGSGYR